jgi:Mg-chelatase subunit ChlD
MAKQRRTAPDAVQPASAPKRAAAKKTATKTAAAKAPVAAAARQRFTLFSFLGKPRSYYLVDRVPLNLEKTPTAKEVAHAIIIIDRSGSMYSDIEATKNTLVKLLTLDEYRQSDMLVTLLSYSSKGDCKVHFQRAKLRDILKPNSDEIKEIKKIHVTGLTCISQAVELAASLAKPNELTAITLHSDGYANHPSPTSEAKTLEKLCEQMQGREVFVNTIAYSNYSDFQLLARVANSVSGNCIKAGNIKEVYDSLYNTAKLLDGSVAPSVEEPLSPEYDYQVFVSHSGNKVLGAAGPLRIRGLKPEDDGAFYKFRKVEKKEYDADKGVPVEQTHEAVLAFARTQLANGNINTAKYAVASTFDATLLNQHAKALTNLQVAALATDLDAVLFQPAILQEHDIHKKVPVNERTPIVTLVGILAEHRDGFLVNMKQLLKDYQRRGLKRVQGTRDENGNLVKPWLKTEDVDAGDYAQVGSFDINRNTANLNVLIPRKVRLVAVADGKPVTEVAGVPLNNLTTFNNYTLVGDGELNVKALTLRINQKPLYEKLSAAGVLEQDGKPAARFNPTAEYTLKLDDLPLVPPFEAKIDLDGVFEQLAELKVLSSLLAAHLKEESATFTPEQVEELKRHYITKSLNLSFPTTTEYTDLQQALSDGSVDTRVSFKVDIGNRAILSTGKLHSANKFLDRMYELVDARGQVVEKPTFDQTLAGGVTYRHKTLSARTRVTPVDHFMRRLFDDFLGLEKNGSVAALLKKVGDTKLAKVLQQKHAGKPVPQAEFVAALTEARREVEDFAEGIYQEKVSPLVFYIGSTGLLPDEIDTKALTAEELAAKYPDLALSKDEAEGTFFEVGETIISVYAKNEYFTRRSSTPD